MIIIRVHCRRSDSTVGGTVTRHYLKPGNSTVIELIAFNRN
jgi:hypothetical protein